MMTGPQFPGLAEKVAFLGRADSYPHRPDTVTVKETHMSWVFLAGSLVYKLKKPVSYPFLDFATLEARRVNCLEEVRLNTRLAGDTYLGVVPLHADGSGALSFAPVGPAVEWLVCMKRLPSDRMLDEQIAAGILEVDDVRRAAARLMRFYDTAPRLDVRPEDIIARFAAEHADDARLLASNRFALDHDVTQRALSLMPGALSAVTPLLQQRAAAKAYVEGHGDLRPEHVCLTPEPVFIDCLEFNRDLRVLDPFDEIAYLALECERLGAAWAGEVFLSAAQDRLSPAAPEVLINFYRAARALLRARLAVAHLLEPNPRTPEKWEPRARQYIAIAATALEALQPASIRS